MVEAYGDDNGQRVIVRHIGPPGRGIPEGGTTGQIFVKASNTDFDGAWANAPDGTDAVLGPVSSVNGNFALFDGTTGKLIKDSGRALSYYASAASLATKVDVDGDKVLSDENFTADLKTKLDGLITGNFRGSFEDYATLVANDFDPVPQPGDYCFIEVLDDVVIEVLWDSVNEEWTEQAIEPVVMTGGEIATAVFATADSVSYTQADCRIFTSAEKSQLASLATLAGFADPAYGSISFFNLTGTPVTIVALSDGLTNMVKVDVTSALTGISTLFDNGGASNGRIRYKGTSTRTFWVTAKVGFTGATTDVLVFGIAKNGTVDITSRALKAMDASGTVDSLTLSALISLAENDYLEVFVGNTTDTSAPTVTVLSIEAAGA